MAARRVTKPVAASTQRPPRGSDAGGAAVVAGSKFGLGWTQIARALRQARWPMLTIFVSCVLTAAIAVSLIPRTYSAATRVALDIGGADTVTGIALGRRQIDPYIVTQMLVATDLDVGREVAKKLGWLEDPDLRARWQATTGGAGEFDRWAAQIIATGVSVNMIPDSNLMELSYRAGNAEFAKEVALALRAAYIDVSLRKQATAAARTADLFAAQRRLAGERRTEAQTRLNAFQEANHLTLTRHGLTTEENGLASLQATMGEAKIAAEKRLTSGSVAAGTAAGMSAALPRRAVELDSAVAAATARLGPAHPAVRALVAQQQRAHEAQERQLATARTNADRLAARAAANSTALDTSLQEQARIVTGLQPQLSQLRQLEQAAAYAAATEARLAAREAYYRMLAERTESDMVVVGDAIVDPKPVFPNVPLTIGLSILFGAGLALVVALFVEIQAMRVRSRQALELATNADVLAVIGDRGQWQQRRRWPRWLVRGGNDNPPVQWQLAQ